MNSNQTPTPRVVRAGRRAVDGPRRPSIRPPGVFLVAVVAAVMCVAASTFLPSAATAATDDGWRRVHIELHSSWPSDSWDAWLSGRTGRQDGVYPYDMYGKAPATSPWDNNNAGTIIWNADLDASRYDVEVDVHGATLRGHMYDRASDRFPVDDIDCWWAKHIDPTGNVGEPGTKGAPLKIDNFRGPGGLHEETFIDGYVHVIS